MDERVWVQGFHDVGRQEYSPDLHTFSMCCFMVYVDPLGFSRPSVTSACHTEYPPPHLRDGRSRGQDGSAPAALAGRLAICCELERVAGTSDKNFSHGLNCCHACEQWGSWFPVITSVTQPRHNTQQQSLSPT